MPILSCICTSISCLNFKHAITGASSLVHLTFPVLIMQLVAADEGISKPSSFYKHLASVAGQRSVFGTLLVPTMLFPPHTPVLPPLPPSLPPSTPPLPLPRFMGSSLLTIADYPTWKPRRKLYDHTFKRRCTIWKKRGGGGGVQCLCDMNVFYFSSNK